MVDALLVNTLRVRHEPTLFLFLLVVVENHVDGTSHLLDNLGEIDIGVHILDEQRIVLAYRVDQIDEVRDDSLDLIVAQAGLIVDRRLQVAFIISVVVFRRLSQELRGVTHFQR